MKYIKKTAFLRHATAFCLTLTMLASSSMFVLAAPDSKVLLGEISISGNGENGEPPFVKVNGERAVTGRTFPSYSMIETSAATSADVNLGTVGRISLSPDSTLILSFSENSISGKLLTGKIRVSNAKGVSVNIETPDNALSNDKEIPGAFTIDVQSGATQATAETGSIFFKDGLPAGKAQTTSSGGSGLWIPLAVYAAIVGVAVTYVVISRNDDDNVVSPIR